MLAGIYNKDDIPIRKGSLVSICIRNSPHPLFIGETIIDLTQVDISSTDAKGKAISMVHMINDKLWDYGTKKVPENFLIIDQQQQQQQDKEDKIKNENKVDDFPPLGNLNLNSTPPQPTTTTTTTTTTTSNSNIDNNDKEDKDKDTTDNNDLPMEELLLISFLGAIKKGIKDSDLPIVLKTVFSKHMMYYSPVGQKPISIKESSYKKVSVFMKKMEEKGLIELKEPTPGNIVISKIFRNNPELGYFKVGKVVGEQEPEESKINDNDNDNDNEEQVFGTIENDYIPIKSIKKVYQIPATLRQYCLDHKPEPLIGNHDKYFTTGELQKFISQYIIEMKLEDPVKRAFLTVDHLLSTLARSKDLPPSTATGRSMEKGKYFTAVRDNLSAYIEINRVDDSQQRKPMSQIQIHVKKIQNKWVMLVSNLDLFSIPIKELAHEGMKLFAASTTIDKNVLKIQGNDSSRVSLHLQKKYNIPSEFIEEINTIKKKK